MTLKLPSHMQGWKIPAKEHAPELTVIYAGSWLGPHYEAGTLNAAWTELDPKTANAWVVEGDSHSGLAVMDFKTDRNAPRHETRRATAAMLHFCLQADGPAGTGYLPAGGVIYLPDYKVRETPYYDKDHLIAVGFEETGWNDELIGNPERIIEQTARRYPELGEAVQLLSRTVEEEIALAAAARAAAPVATEQ